MNYFYVALIALAVGMFIGSEMVTRWHMKYYRRWYLMCRNAVEEMNPNHPVLKQIGPRTSKREPWEA